MQFAVKHPPVRLPAPSFSMARRRCTVWIAVNGAQHTRMSFLHFWQLVAFASFRNFSLSLSLCPFSCSLRRWLCVLFTYTSGCALSRIQWISMNLIKLHWLLRVPCEIIMYNAHDLRFFCARVAIFAALSPFFFHFVAFPRVRFGFYCM